MNRFIGRIKPLTFQTIPKIFRCLNFAVLKIFLSTVRNLLAILASNGKSLRIMDVILGSLFLSYALSFIFFFLSFIFHLTTKKTARRTAYN